VLYVGDDDTDEDVFVLGGSDGLLGIRVGESEESAAAYCVRDQESVDELLGLLLQAG
jgi:trehalose-6-phosphatase